MKIEAGDSWHLTSEALTKLRVPHYRVCDLSAKGSPPLRFVFLPETDVERVMAARDSIADGKIARAAAKRQQRERIERERVERESRIESIVATISDDQAMSLGCESLFRLNRAAKSGHVDARTVYDLKDRWIALLCKTGHCIGCQIHTVHEPERSVPDYYDDGEFEHKGSTRPKVYPARHVDYVSFLFGVEGTRYSWHLRKTDIRFTYRPTEEGKLVEFDHADKTPSDDYNGDEDLESLEAAIRRIIASQNAF